MAGRTPAEAVSNYVAPLQRVIDCVHPSVLSASTYHPRGGPGALNLNRGQAIRLGGPSQLALRIFQTYDIVRDNDVSPEGEPYGPWRVRTTSYYYTLEDKEGPEVLAFHWHPIAAPAIAFPHLHLGPAPERCVRISRRRTSPPGGLPLRISCDWRSVTWT